ncbi:MAG: M23 family metallopeptidase [Saprospiraceae bacterium]|nr:M23 family metallopeptidase [Candidatus Vicinibacter affinis]
MIRHGKTGILLCTSQKNSLQVKPGDKVIPGQKIASVGCSGNCTDPHLHFELWYDSTLVVDTFDGPCGNQFNFWRPSSLRQQLPCVEEWSDVRSSLFGFPAISSKQSKHI